MKLVVAANKEAMGAIALLAAIGCVVVVESFSGAALPLRRRHAPLVLVPRMTAGGEPPASAPTLFWMTPAVKGQAAAVGQGKDADELEDADGLSEAAAVASETASNLRAAGLVRE